MLAVPPYLRACSVLLGDVRGRPLLPPLWLAILA
eukprot:SAG31_NODE_25097_length_468_cov_0.734417_1_plen_33_part_01